MMGVPVQLAEDRLARLLRVGRLPKAHGEPDRQKRRQPSDSMIARRILTPGALLLLSEPRTAASSSGVGLATKMTHSHELKSLNVVDLGSRWSRRCGALSSRRPLTEAASTPAVSSTSSITSMVQRQSRV